MHIMQQKYQKNYPHFLNENIELIPSYNPSLFRFVICGISQNSAQVLSNGTGEVFIHFMTLI